MSERNDASHLSGPPALIPSATHTCARARTREIGVCPNNNNYNAPVEEEYVPAGQAAQTAAPGSEVHPHPHPHMHLSRRAHHPSVQVTAR